MKTLYYNGKIISEGQLFEGAVLAENGFVADILPGSRELPPADEKIDLHGAYLAPGFVDTHIHGCGDFGADSKNPRDLLEMSKLLLKQGVIAFAPTIYPGKIDDMADTLQKLAPAIGREEGAKILGFHLEGPFISPDKPGVMKPADIQPINIESAKKLYTVANGKITAMTVAPELENIDKLAAFAGENNFILQAGHTNATYEQMLQAAQLGIKHATHLFNATSPLNHRAPGAPGAVLTDGRFTTEIIADGAHLHPAVVKMILMLKGPCNIMLVSDVIKQGIANGEEVQLKGNVFRRKSDDVIAGGALGMLDGLKNLVKWGYPLAYASMAASDNPAALYKLNAGAIAKGKAAQFVVLDKDLNLQNVIF